MANYTFAPFNFFIFLRKGERRSRVVAGGVPRRMGWEACTAVVACFISIIVQAGLWVLQGCFVCHSPEPPGYQGLAFPVINIQRFTSRAKAGSAWIWIYIYLFTLFLNLFMHFPPLCSRHHPSRCLFLSACGGAIFDTSFVIHHTCLFVPPSSLTGLQRNPDI